MVRRVLIVAALPLLSLSAFADSWDMGNGNDQGVIQTITEWNNQAQNFGSSAQMWKAKYTPEKVKRGPAGEKPAAAISYCLGGKKEVLGLLNTGNSTSLNYEGYLSSHPGDPNVMPAYTNHEANLQSLNRQYKEVDKAAPCN